MARECYKTSINWLSFYIPVPYSDNTTSSDESEPEVTPMTQVSILSWSESSSKVEEDKQHPSKHVAAVDLGNHTPKSPVKRVQAGRKAHNSSPSGSPFTTPRSKTKHSCS